MDGEQGLNHPIWNKLAVVGSVMFIKMFSGIFSSMPSLHVISMYEGSVRDMEAITQFASLFFTMCFVIPVGLESIWDTSRH